MREISMAVRSIFPYTKIVQKPLSKALLLHLITLGGHIRKKRTLAKRCWEILSVDEDSIVAWENGKWQTQIWFYPQIIAFFGYYPFLSMRQYPLRKN